MFQRDYILRLVEQMAQLVAKLIGLDPEKALEVIDENFTEWLGFGADYIDDIPADQLLDVLINKNNLNVNQLEFLAELLGKQGLAYIEMQQNLTAKDKLNKSLIIFDFVDEQQGLFSLERMNTLSSLKKHLKNITI